MCFRKSTLLDNLKKNIFSYNVFNMDQKHPKFKDSKELKSFKKFQELLSNDNNSSKRYKKFKYLHFLNPSFKKNSKEEFENEFKKFKYYMYYNRDFHEYSTSFISTQHRYPVRKSMTNIDLIRIISQNKTHILLVEKGIF